MRRTPTPRVALASWLLTPEVISTRALGGPQRATHRARAAPSVRRTTSRNPRRFLHGDQLGPYAIELSPCLELGRDYSAPDEKIDGYGIYKSREEASEQEGLSMMLSRDVAPRHLQTPGVAIASGG